MTAHPPKPGSVRAQGIVRDLRTDEIAQFRKHLQRLDRASIRDRFNGAAGADVLAAYALRCLRHGAIIAGYFESGVVRGAGELHPLGRDAEGRRTAEVALSVEKDWQRRGVGTRLFRRIIVDARQRGVEVLCITTHCENDSMRALAMRFRARMTFKASGAFGAIDVGTVPAALLRAGEGEDADFAA